MSDTQADGRYALTSPVILGHPALFEARAFMRNGKAKGDPKFGGAFAFTPDHPDLDPLKKLAAKLLRAKFPTLDFKLAKFPFQSGDKLAAKRKEKTGKEDGAWQQGKVIVPGRSKYQPRLAVIENGRIIDLDSDELKAKYKNKFFFGAEVLCEFNLQAYDGSDGDGDDEATIKGGVTCYLNLVLATGKGTRIAGGASAADVFKGYAGAASATDPTGGATVELDDEIPF